MSMVIIQPYILVSKLKKTKTEFLRCTGYLSPIKPYKAKCIANSSSCAIAELSKLSTSCLPAYKNMLLSTVKWNMKDPVKIYFGLFKIQMKLLGKLKARDFNATSLSTYDFSSLYTTLPHNLIKDKLIDRIEEPSIEKDLLTLHLTTEMHSLPRKNLKKIYLVRSCQNVGCAELNVGQHFYSIWHQGV